MPNLIIGLTGKRHVGKSTFAEVLVRSFGFRLAHAFGPGKAMVESYYRYIGVPTDEAYRMVYGDLKDTPHPLLPGGVDSRYFMERFGKFLGTDPELGPEWTLGMEMRRLSRDTSTATGHLFESLVYEHEVFKRNGGIIIRLEREGTRPTGTLSDEHQALIPHDYLFINNGTSKAELVDRIRPFLAEIRQRHE